MNEKLLENLKRKIAVGEFELTRHATDQIATRNITLNEIIEAAEDLELLEDYPDDKYGPTCLLFGQTVSGRMLHMQCTYPNRPLVRVVTIYEPDDARWINGRSRRK